MARRSTKSAASVDGQQETGAANQAGTGKRRGRPSRTDAAPAPVEGAKRRGRPKGSKNKPKVVTGRVGRPRRQAAAPAAALGLGAQIDVLILQLQSLRAEVDRLESQAGQIEVLRAMFSK